MNRVLSTASNLTTGFLFVAILVGISACSGPRVRTADETAEEVDSTDLFQDGSYVWVGAQGPVFVDLSTGMYRRLDGGKQLLYSSIAPDGLHAAFASADADSSWFVVVARTTGRAVRLHAGSADLVYSAAWSPGGDQLAFGFYTPAMANDRPAQGAGDILIANVTDGAVNRLGCTLSKEVVLWSNPDQLVVRATDDMYRVSRENCRTLQEVDIRRWHHITPAPVGSRIAYIYRELAFNRETREYEPDSALFVAGTAGAGGIKVVGDRYRPRHMAWSPDATELAFDVLVEPGGEKRAVAVYDVETTQTVYVSPTSEASPSQTHPKWDPSGSTISIVEDGDRLRVQAATMGLWMDLSVDGSPVTQLLGWLTDSTVLVRDAAGHAWLYELHSSRSRRLGPGTGFTL